jgi:hypothetical protein
LFINEEKNEWLRERGFDPLVVKHEQLFSGAEASDYLPSFWYGNPLGTASNIFG